MLALSAIRRVSGWTMRPIKSFPSSATGASSTTSRHCAFFQTRQYQNGRSSTTALRLVTWDEGDMVAVESADGERFGVVQEARGGGWFTVKMSGTGEIIKCRGTKMKKAHMEIQTKSLTNRIQSSIPVFTSGEQTKGKATTAAEVDSFEDVEISTDDEVNFLSNSNGDNPKAPIPDRAVAESLPDKEFDAVDSRTIDIPKEDNSLNLSHETISTKEETKPVLSTAPVLDEQLDTSTIPEKSSGEGDFVAVEEVSENISSTENPTAPNQRTKSEESVIRKDSSMSSDVNDPEELLRDGVVIPDVIVNSTTSSDMNPPPPSTIHNLDAALLSGGSGDLIISLQDLELLKQVEHHASFDKWVVFTDLHCSPSSLDTCLEVMESVHTFARERDAGVLFLGDFWHQRGTLRVSCLNAVLAHLKTWTVPMVLIPGNHDQVSLGGHSHGLTSLENAYRVNPKTGGESIAGPLIFSYPTKFREAFFIPHIRDTATMDSILKSDESKAAEAIFVHAEVTGALMNDMIVSQNGISPSAFPPFKPIYSGHFHKPHNVKSGDVQIQYFGSPYETSLAEAGQAKSLAVVDASKNWTCVEYIPMDIGRKHFRLSSWDELYDLDPVGVGSGTVKPDDRVVVSVPQAAEDELLDDERKKLSEHIDLLRKSGVSVELRFIKEVPTGVASDTGNVEELSTETTWRNYLSSLVEREVLSDEKKEKMCGIGLDMIEEIMSNQTNTDGGTTRSVNNFRLDSVVLDGFGPFQNSVTYPLSDRGLVLLRGTNNDSGSDSNGSGKSSLAMASLWALTGSLDPRPVEDSKVSDIINDESTSAQVSLHGSLNGVPFTITRTKTLKKASLMFILDDVDRTTQSTKETQQLMEEELGISAGLLSRVIFHGQHSGSELLDSTDSQLKEELSVLVPLQIWQNVASYARTKNRAASKRISELNGMIALRTEDLGKLVLKKEEVVETLSEKTEGLRELYEQMQEEKSGIPNTPLEEDIFSVEARMSAISISMDELNARKKTIEETRDAETLPVKKRLDILRESATSMIERCAYREKEVLTAEFRLETSKSRIEELETKWGITIPHNQDLDNIQLDLPETCPTCSQPIAGHDHGTHTNLMQVVQDDIKGSIEAYKRGQDGLSKAKEDFTISQNVRAGDEQLIKKVEDDLTQRLLKFNTEIESVEAELMEQRDEQLRLSDRISVLARESQKQGVTSELEIKIASEKAAVSFQTEKLESVQIEIDEANAGLLELQVELDEQKEELRQTTELADYFGQRGIQNFILQNTLGALQHISDAYLNELSEGAQKIELSLDANDRITRRAFVLGPGGEFKERPLSVLSGGQWRRCSLAVSLGFAELVARRGKLRPSLCVLDEPLTHLDRSGRARVGTVIQKMLQSDDLGGLGMGSLGMGTVILILQDLSALELEESFDCVDEVVREQGKSRVQVGAEL